MAPNGRVALYSYEDASWEPVFLKHKLADKSYPWQFITEHGWEWGQGGGKPPLYHLPELMEARRTGEDVYVCEGEKDADSLRGEGLVATTPPDNGVWPAGRADPLSGLPCWVCYDNDPAGHERAHWALRALRAVGARVLGCLRAYTGNDVTDHLAAGYAVDQLVEEDPPKARKGAAKKQYGEPDEKKVEQLVDAAGPAAPLVHAVLTRYMAATVEGDAELMTDEDILALAPPAWLIDGFVPAVGVTAVWGSPGVGKSTLADDWQDQVRRGGDWNGWRVEQGSVLNLAGEGAQQHHNRIKALLQARGTMNGAAPRLLTQENWDITTMYGLARVVRAAYRVQQQADNPLVLVEVDPVGLYGAREREGVEDTESIAKATWALAQGLGCAVVVMQHANAAGVRGRGTDHLRMYCETYCRLEAMGSASVALSHDGKNRPGELRAMRFERLSVGPGPVLNMVRGGPGDVYTPDDVAREQQERGEQAREEGKVRRKAAATADPANWGAVLEVLPSSGGLSARGVAELSGVPRAVCSDVLKSLQTAGKAAYEEGPRGAMMWRKIT